MPDQHSIEEKVSVIRAVAKRAARDARLITQLSAQVAEEMNTLQSKEDTSDQCNCNQG